MSEGTIGKGLVVFIDDNISDQQSPVGFYKVALEDEDYEVMPIAKLSEALYFIRTTKAQPILWIVDVMMPVLDASLEVDGELLSKATSSGLASGRVLYRQIRKRFPITPVIMLTNVTAPEILEDIEAEMDPRAICEAKITILPSDLVELVKAYTTGEVTVDQPNQP